MTEETPFEDDRIENLENLEEAEVQPYNNPDVSPIEVEEFVNRYEDEIEDETEVWELSGRVTRMNEFGDFAFLDIDDRTAEVQIMCVRENMEDEYDLLYDIDLGDVVSFTGTPEYSDTGELSLNATTLNVCSKSLNYLADEYNQFSTRRQITDRTGALASNDELFNNVDARFQVQTAIRDYLTQLDYTEVDTPTLHNVSGGAKATPFETHLNALDSDVYLRIAPELYLKRLITAGYDRVFEIGRSYRNEDIDTTHNPEFTMLELYETYSDYRDMITLLEALFESVAESLYGDTVVTYDGMEIDFSESWDVVKFDTLVEQEIGMSIEEAVYESETIRNHIETECGENVSSNLSFDGLLMEVFETCIEDGLEGPVVVINYPTVSTPLCQSVYGDETRLQRFEAFVAGMEVANSYTELTDPREQMERLIKQAGGQENANMDFVEALSYGMPPTAGMGIGVDRLAMIMTDSQSIKDVLPFPMSSERR